LFCFKNSVAHVCRLQQVRTITGGLQT
jgi:hypothetical protein